MRALRTTALTDVLVLPRTPRPAVSGQSLLDGARERGRSAPPVHIHAALAAELAQLTATMDDPAIDLAGGLDRLAVAATAAVASFRGLSITTTSSPGEPVTFTHVPIPGTILASLRAPLPPSPGALTLYGGAPGAFVDLGADITWLAGTNLADIKLDQHLRPPALLPSGGLRDIVSINQAIGVLLNRGYLPEEGRSQLDAWADAHGTNRQQAAQHLLAHLDDPGPDRGPRGAASHRPQRHTHRGAV